jgi:hypothetical protein
MNEPTAENEQGEPLEKPGLAKAKPPPTILPSAGYGTRSTGSRGVTYQTEAEPRRRPRLDVHADALESAREAIVRLNDVGDSLAAIDRSNLFDDWKEALERAAEDGSEQPPPRRQITGMLLSATLRKDVVDFTFGQLAALRQVTNMVRCFPMAGDVRRATRVLSENGLLRPLGLSADLGQGDEDAALDTFIERALQRRNGE